MEMGGKFTSKKVQQVSEQICDNMPCLNRDHTLILKGFTPILKRSAEIHTDGNNVGIRFPSLGIFAIPPHVMLGMRGVHLKYPDFHPKFMRVSRHSQVLRVITPHDREGSSSFVPCQT